MNKLRVNDMNKLRVNDMTNDHVSSPVLADYGVVELVRPAHWRLPRPVAAAWRRPSR